MPIVEIQQAAKSLGNTFQLGPLDLSLESGEILGIMGPNGAGKTTLLKLAWGFFRPDGGEISVFGMRPHLDQIKIRLQAGYLSETPQFYGWMRARRFLAFISNFYEAWDARRAARLLSDFRIDPEQRIETLSRGNRIKLGLISAVAHRPELLILDEPTAGLDPIVRLDILTFLRTLARDEGVGILLSSHISDDLDQIADTVLMLNEGRVVEYARTSAILDRYHLSHLEAVFLHVIGRIPQHHSKGLGRI